MADLVSVIMPVHNASRYLRDALDSVLAQTYAPIEIVVVDDGSTDSSPEILKEYGSRIRYLRQENKGAAAARNVAIEASQGAFIAFLDADDLWTRDKLRIQIEYLNQHPQIDLVASQWQVLEAGSELDLDTVVDPATVSIDQPSEWLYNELLMDCLVHTTTVVMRRRLVEKIGLFDVSLRRGQDYDYWLRASRVTPIHRLEARLSVYRLHEGNSTWRPQPVNYAALVIERALKRWGRVGPDGRKTSISHVRRRLADEWANFAYQHATRGSIRTAFRAAFTSLATWPLQTGVFRILALCAVAPMRRKER
jgi:glycosyltransferase involved in cell wall biosynthesis